MSKNKNLSLIPRDEWIDSRVFELAAKSQNHHENVERAIKEKSDGDERIAAWKKFK